MWLSDRRAFLLGAAALGGCGFAPAYGPGGAARRLQDAIHVDAPDTRETFLVTQRVEERLGAGGPAAPYTLGLQIGISETSQGKNPSGDTTRFRMVGRLTYSLRRAGEATAFRTGTVRNFTGYSATGSTAATLAANRDARERLLIILADQMIDRLVLGAADLPEA